MVATKNMQKQLQHPVTRYKVFLGRMYHSNVISLNISSIRRPIQVNWQNKIEQNKTKQVICFVELDASSNQQANDIAVDETSAIFQDYLSDAYLGLFL